MTTPRTRAIVSLVATMTVTLGLGACARGPARPAPAAAATTQGRLPTVRFDNEGREHVHVYLIGERREWLLGRVEPGARVMLRVPTASRAETGGFVRLAVVTGGRVTLRASRDTRATLTIAQPASSILSQRWMFAQGQLTTLGRPGAPAGLGQP